MNALDAADNALTVQPTGGTAVNALRQGVVERIVHTLLQPQVSVIALLNLVNTVVTKRRGVITI